MKTYRILSLGAGVQSTALYLMAMKFEIEPIDCAIFADTQEEPAEVYRHLEWMKSLGGPRIYVGTQGSLGDQLIHGVPTLTTRKGSRNTTGNHFASIPAFTLNGTKKGITRRQCTAEFKLNVIDRTFKREIVGLVPRQRMPKDVQLQQIIGISLDETKRALRIRDNHRDNDPWWKLEPQFPLIKNLITREDCKTYLAKHCPHVVPRSACVFCPYHNNAEWRRLKADSVSWARIVAIDVAIRDVEKSRACYKAGGQLFLHNSCKPITEVDFGTEGEDDVKDQQTNMGFWKECLGMCGN